MIMQDLRDKEVVKEYYLFLYDLAVEKNYSCSSQLTLEERKYCEKLLSNNQTRKPNVLYLSLIEDILEESIRRQRNTKKSQNGQK